MHVLFGVSDQNYLWVFLERRMSERMQGKPGGDKAPVLKDGQGFDTSWIPEFLQPGVGHAMRA